MDNTHEAIFSEWHENTRFSLLGQNQACTVQSWQTEFMIQF